MPCPRKCKKDPQIFHLVENPSFWKRSMFLKISMHSIFCWAGNAFVAEIYTNLNGLCYESNKVLGLGIRQVVPDQMLSAWQWYLIISKSHLWLATITQSTFKIATLNRFCTNIGSPCLPLDIISHHCSDVTSWWVVNSFAVTIIYHYLSRKNSANLSASSTKTPSKPFLWNNVFQSFQVTCVKI